MKKGTLTLLVAILLLPVLVQADSRMFLADTKFDYNYTISPGSWKWIESSGVVENMGFYGKFTVDSDVDFFIVNQAGYDQISGGGSASSSNVLHDFGSDLTGTVEFTFRAPDVNKMYWCFSNWDSIFTTINVQGYLSRDTTAPALDIIGPNNHQTVDGTIFIQADAEDAHFDIGLMRIYIDDVLRKTEYSDSISYSWDTTTVADGQHSVSFYVSDNVNNDNQVTRYVTVDNVPDQTNPVNPGATTDPVNPGGGNTAPLSPMIDTTTMMMLGIVGVVAVAGIAFGVSRRNAVEKEPRTIITSEKVFVVCHYCGAKNEQGRNNCEKCGADL